jgi:hypothetical protein
MEWRGADGEERAATFNDDVTRDPWGPRLRTALSLDGDWLPTVLGRAHERLAEVRRTHPTAGGLVIAIDHEHARGIANLLKRLHRVDAKIALSDDPKASHVIADFAQSDDEWIVAVRMISEGVDIPRLRVGVFATTTATPMFFRQAVGRIARWTPGMRSQRAYLFLPDDPRLRLHALGIAQARRHSIELKRSVREAEPGELDDNHVIERAEEQMSLFAALSSTVLGTDGDAEGDGDGVPADGIDPSEDVPVAPSDTLAFTIDLPPPPPLPGRVAALDGVPATGTRRGEKTRLRDRNAALVADLARITGMNHRAVNSELNRLAGVVRITDATVEQLHRRLQHARTWLESPETFVPGRAPAPSAASRRTEYRAADTPDDQGADVSIGRDSTLEQLRRIRRGLTNEGE